MSVFFSLLSVLIVIGLYVLFLGDLQIQSVKQQVCSVKGIGALVSSWVMAGIIVVGTVTIPLGILGNMVEDEDRKRIKDFLVAPIGRGQLIGGYLIASWIVGILLSVISLVLAEVYILYQGGALLTGLALMKVLGLIVLSVISSSSLMLFLTTFTKTTSAFAALTAIVGTMIGFLTGIYVPIGVLPTTVQTMIKLVPASYAATLMRQIFMEAPLQAVFAKAPDAYRQAYETTYGVQLFWGGHEVGAGLIIAVLAVTGVVAFALSVCRLLKRP